MKESNVISEQKEGSWEEVGRHEDEQGQEEEDGHAGTSRELRVPGYAADIPHHFLLVSPG